MPDAPDILDLPGEPDFDAPVDGPADAVPDADADTDTDTDTDPYPYAEGPSEGLLSDALASDSGEGSFLVLAWAVSNGKEEAFDRYISRLRAEVLTDEGPVTFGDFMFGRRINGYIIGVALGLQNPAVAASLTAQEREALDVVCKAAIASTVFLSHPERNGNWYTLDGTRTWANVNLSLPYMGVLRAGAIAVGLDETVSFLENYDHETFLQDLLDHGFEVHYATFAIPSTEEAQRYINGDWYFAFPSYYSYPDKYTGTDITVDVPVRLEHELTKFAFEHDVPTGPTLWGYIEGQPHAGERGMLHEFKTQDGGDEEWEECAGHVNRDRDDLGYSAEGFHDAVFNRLLLVQTGFWHDSRYSEITEHMKSLHEVGADDLFYKIDAGTYESYAKGHCRDEAGSNRIVWARPIFEEIR